MTLLGSGFRRILLLLIAAICIILIALNIILNIKLRTDIPNLIEQFSKETPYDIEVGKISLDPLFRLQLDQVIINDPSLQTKEVLNVDRVTVEPHIISSLLGQKIKLGEIVFKNPQVQSNKDNVDKLIDFIESRQKDEEAGLIELGTIKILDGEFQITPEFLVLIPSLNIELSNNTLERGQEINVQGKVDLLQKELALKGVILISSEQTSGEFSVGVDKILVPPSLGSSESLKAVVQLNFVVSKLIAVNGQLKVNSEGFFTEKPFAEIKYDLNYDKAGDIATVNSLDFSLRDLLKGTLSGRIDKVIKETAFNLTGKTAPLNLKDVMVQVFNDDRGFLSGDLVVQSLKITGSRKKNDIRLTGDALIEGFNFSSENEDDPSISNLDCNLKVKQNLSASSGFPLSSTGRCLAEKFFWDKTGQVHNIDTQVNLNSKEKWSDNKVALSNINSSYMGGIATGALNFILSEGFAGGITGIGGNIKGSNLNLKKTPKAIIPANIAGNAQGASATFQGGSSNYKADISLTINNFVLKSKKEREFRVSRLQTSGAVSFVYKSLSEQEDTADKDEIIIKGKGVTYERLSFEEYLVNSGTVEELDFLLELGHSRWTLDMSSQGSGFSIAGHDVSLEKFNESLSIENSGREGFKGTINGTGGRYKSIDFPTLSWDYNFVGDRIIVANVSAQISTIGEFKTDALYVNVGSEVGGYPYKVDFDKATFVGFEEKLNSQGIKGDFLINKPGTADLDWYGSVNINRTSIVSAVVDNISNSVIPSPGGIKLQNITGKFLGGEISGNIDIDTTKSPSGIEAGLKLFDASIDTDALDVKLNESSLKFSGTLPNGSLPEGQSKLELKNIVLENNEVSSKLDASINVRTVAETLYIDRGFIKDINNKTINFSGEMTNSLNENRTLKLKFPEVPIPDALGILSPLVPSDFREFKTRGYAEMDVLFHSLFYPQGGWSGKLSLRGGSFSGDYGGALLTVDGVDGTITIKDKVSSENPLATLMGEHLKLSKRVFQKFLKSFNEANLQEDLDFLNIQKIEYGILKFEDIECALEVDQQKINLRRLLSKLFRGNFYGAGLIKLNQDPSTYNLSLLFNEISLESLSEKVSPGQEYITGRVNGLVWLTADGSDLNTVDGPFKFWSKKSSKEQRKIGKALLDKLGAKERLILGSNRSYNNGNISGYINDGLITFKEFDISNSVLGIKNLSIQADPVRNSITILHLISVVREIARRSETGGGPTIETN